MYTLPRAAMHSEDYVSDYLSVRHLVHPSACLSVTLWYCVKMAKYIVKTISLSLSAIILVFFELHHITFVNCDERGYIGHVRYYLSHSSVRSPVLLFH